MWRVVLILWLCIASADAAFGCRCPQQRLGSYFRNAEYVFLGKVAAVEVSHDPKDPRRVVRFAIQGNPYKGDPAQLREFATPLSSATCGYAVEQNQLYLIFANRRAVTDQVAWFDTCNGSRGYDPKSEEGVQGFVDVPAAAVLPTLRRLGEGYDTRTTVKPQLPTAGDPSAKVIGLLELPTLLGSESVTPTAGASIALYGAPANDATRLEAIRRREDVVTREYAYESAGAVVESRRPGWFRIALPKGRSGWIRAEDAGRFHPLNELLVGRLTYLGGSWDGWIWPDPGAGHPAPGAGRVVADEQPVNVIATQDIGGSLWLQVELLDRSPCDGEQPKVTHGGWVPAYTASGEPVAWFYARGC